MVILTSVFVAEVKSQPGAAQLLEQEVLFANDKSALEGVRELVSMYEGKNRVEPIE